MALRFTIKKILPFVLIYIAFLVSAVTLHLLLDLSGFKWTLRYLGIAGTILILVSFVYSLRKRKVINFGKAKLLLFWFGSLIDSPEAQENLLMHWKNLTILGLTSLVTGRT